MRPPSFHRAICLATAALAALPFAAWADDDVPAVLPPAGAVYSPYLDDAFPNRVFFGDTHVHTSYSADAGMIGNRLGPDEAYRFANGQWVISSTGVPARLSRPLDFLVVADHSENLGLAPLLAVRDPALIATPFGAALDELVQAGDLLGAFKTWTGAKADGTDPLAAYPEIAFSAWTAITEAAERHNDPGLFTALIGFEWTSGPGRNNLHRNVIFRGGKATADTIIPLSAYDTVDPEDLWAWMEKYEADTGDRVLAIPHNGNLSNGLMFADTTLSGEPLTADYATRRARWEPLYEVTQMKGDGEAHPFLSPDDAFADFETWDKGQLGPAPKTPEMLPNEYAREALKRGLAHEAALGVNPWNFGMIGSTDAHTSLSTTQENNFFGKVAALEPTGDPIRFNEVIAGTGGPPEAAQYAWQTSASGLAAVWARENTREALWDAMARKEVYATTGTRILLRLFAGYGFTAEDLVRSDFARHGYEVGVPMGGDLAAAPEGGAPRFLIRALRDAEGANLDRIQIVKGWMNPDGTLGEKVFNLAWSGDRQPDAKGYLPAVGSTVNVAEASYTNAIGAPALQAFWQDPEFDPAVPAFYYVRVLEIPTPRWTTYDAKAFGVTLPEGAPTEIQERAYSSPVWYRPAG